MMQVIFYPGGDTEVYSGVFPVVPDDKDNREVAVAYIHGGIITITTMRFGRLGEPAESVEAVIMSGRILYDKGNLREIIEKYIQGGGNLPVSLNGLKNMMR